METVRESLGGFLVVHRDYALHDDKAIPYIADAEDTRVCRNR